MNHTSTSSSVGGENRSGDGDSEMATAGGRPNHDDDDDPQMARLLHRLRREHATNFGTQHDDTSGGVGVGIAGDSSGGGETRVNRTRARYLLEASAGNVGLASALYWEDYLAEAERGDAENIALLHETGGPAAAPAKASGDGDGKASSTAKENYNDNEDVPLNLEGELTKRSDGGSSSKKKLRYGVDSDFELPQKKRYKRENSFGLDSSSPFSSSAHDDDVVSARMRPNNETAPKEKVKANNSGISSIHNLGSAGEDEDDNPIDDVARMQNYLRGSTTTLSSMHQFQRQLDEKISSLQERLTSYRWQWQNDATFAAAPAPADRLSSYQLPSNAAPSSAASLSNPNHDATMQAAVSAALHLGVTTAATASSSSSSGNLGSNNPSSVAVAAATARAGPPNFWRLGNSDYLGNGSAFGLGPEDGHHSALFGSVAAARGGGGIPPRMSIEEIHRAIQALQDGERFPSAVAARQFISSTNASADAASLPIHQMNYGFGPPPFDWLSRTMPYNPYQVAGVGGAPPMNDAGHQAVMATLLRDRSAIRTSASGGGEGGNDGEDSDDDTSSGENAGRGNRSPRRDEREQDENNDASNRSNARDGLDDADGGNDNAAEEDDFGEAPLRRSMRIRSSRSRPSARNLPPRPRPALAARMRRNHLNDADDDDMPADPEEAPWMVRRALRVAARAAAVAALANNNDASVDISDDDEAAFRPGPMPVFRLKKGSDSSGKRKCAQSNSNEKNNEAFDCSDDDDDYSTVSRDIDLLLHNSMSSVSKPSRNLWESHPRHSGESEGEDIAVEEAEVDRVSFPASWLRSGFKLAQCGNGLVMSAPPVDDRGRINRSFTVLREGALKGMKGAFPYNCMGVSALLSIVSALLHSGASIQNGAAVACDVDRVPFSELSLDQRKREFDSRLTDALSSLIFVAAQAGSLRYKEILNIYDRQWARRCQRKGHITPEEEDIHMTKRMALQRRSRVCEVCWWPTDIMNGGATIFPEGKDPKDVHFKTSFTNIRDIKSYVKTNLRSFKEAGGCALFLETIVHCHSKSIHLPPSFPLNCESFALECKCSQALKRLQTNAKNKRGDANIATMQEDNDCMTVELFSLLLTGQVHHNYENWSADMFGIGILRINANARNKLGPRLLRPIKPIWICLGDLGYSMIFLDMKTFIGHTRTLDDPGKTFQLAHWNCWSGELSKFRVITPMHDEEVERYSRQERPILIPCTSSDSEEEGRTVAESISARLHLEHKRDAPITWGPGEMNKNPDDVDPDFKSIGDDDLQSVTFHPEDKKFYPGQYRRWRFKIGSSPAPDDGWIPFYRLHGRLRLLVEMKLAPRICTLIRSRWPSATVRDFVPNGKIPMV